LLTVVRVFAGLRVQLRSEGLNQTAAIRQAQKYPGSLPALLRVSVERSKLVHRNKPSNWWEQSLDGPFC
jgi:hypothetical protein